MLLPTIRFMENLVTSVDRVLLLNCPVIIMNPQFNFPEKVVSKNHKMSEGLVQNLDLF